MYLKILGLMIIFISCVYIGKFMASSYEKRYIELLTFINFIDYFETEISYTSTPVIEILDSLTDKIKSPFKEIIIGVSEELTSYGYRPLCTVWEENLYNNKNKLSLSQEDLELLIYFGNILGTTDMENQKKYFTVIKSRLQVQLTQAYEKKLKYTKLFKELGIIIGLFIVILII
ncbi:hypothetical protein GC105_04955 [Alkalibaculum sp. M08DMB]|uniref:Stage III sporulation protein AB n=1 Tax=Alkalibaculum sporogenes TaxID=2655001 RepID=A0A6A7K7G3_9FIRM|nr:stage III sporulation protein AB [Alkalibaculum sporogenes]MPW25137.1 hypothetical protein [Alkalibaculum sporogenes]